MVSAAFTNCRKLEIAMDWRTATDVTQGEKSARGGLIRHRADPYQTSEAC